MIRSHRSLRGIALLLAMTIGLSGPIGYSSSVLAEDAAPLSLSDLLQELRRANPDLLAAKKQVEAMQARVPAARGLPPPRIGVKFEEIPRGTFKVNQATVMYSLLQSIPFPGKLSLRHQVAVAEAQRAAAAFKKAELDLTTQLKTAYYDLFLTDREMEIQREQKIWLDQALESARARYGSGGISQTELLRAQSEALEAANQAGVLAHRRRALEAHLNHLLSRPVEEAVGRPGEIALEPVPSDPAALTAKALENQPELLVFKFSAERGEADWKLAKRELWPDLETMVELRDPAMGPIGPWDLSLALVLPFWFWTKEKYGVRVALFNKESAEAAFQGARNEAARQVYENWNEATAAYDTAKLCKDSLIPLASQAVSSEMVLYQSGRSSFMELLETLRMLAERKRTYYEHLAGLEQRVLLLEQAVGVALRKEHS